MGTAVISPERRAQLEAQAAAAQQRANAPKMGTVLHTPPTGGPMMMAPPNGQPMQGQTQNFGVQSPQRQYTPNPFAMGPQQPPPGPPPPGMTNPGYQPSGPIKGGAPAPTPMGPPKQPQMAPPQQAPMSPGATNQNQLIRAIRGTTQ